MLRCTIEILPHGDATKARKLGIIEIANDGTGTWMTGNYVVCLKKTPPWKGALKDIWKTGKLTTDSETEEVMIGKVAGFDRQRRGVYDLLFLALRVCGLNKRNP